MSDKNEIIERIRERLEACLHSTKQFPVSDFGNGQVSAFLALLLMLDEIEEES